MSKREEIYSMFGLKSPQQIEAERRAREDAFMNAQQTASGRAGVGLGTALGSMFRGLGFESDEMKQAREAEKVMQEAMGAGDGEIAQMAAMANRFSEMGMPQAAMGALNRLNELKQTEKDRRQAEADRLAQQEANEAGFLKTFNKQEVVEVPGVDDFGKPIMVSEIVNVPYQYDVRDPQNTQVRLGSGGVPTPAPNPNPAPDPNAPVPVTGPIVRAFNGTRLEKASDGNYYLVVTGTDGEFRGGLVTNPRLVEEESATGGRGNVVGATPSTRGQMGRNNPARTVTAPQQTNIPSGQARLQRRAQ